MRRLRKIWKIIAGGVMACILIGVYIAYVSASTNVKLTMVNTNVVVVQGNTATLSVNMTGTDDNNPNPNDKSPIPANVEWTTDDKSIMNFVDATAQSGYSELVNGNSSVIHANFAGIAKISATYYSKVYDANGIVTQKENISTASLDSVVPLIVTLIDNAGNSNISGKIYSLGDTVNITTNTYTDNASVIETSNTGVVKVVNSAYNNATLSIVGGGSAKVTIRTADGDGNNNLTYSFTVNAKVDFTDGAVSSSGERIITLDKTPFVAFERTLIKSNVITPSQSGAIWESGDASILTAYGNGEVLGLYAGVTALKAGIQVTDVGGNKTFLPGSFDTITVITPFKWLNSVENMNVTDTFQLSCSGKKGELTWTTSDNKVLTVDANGLVTAVGSGTATISVARPTDINNQTNKYGETYSVSMTIQVIDSFGLSTTSKEINIGESYGLKALTTTSNAVISFKVTNEAEIGQTPPTYQVVSTTTSTDGKTLTITGVASGIVRVVATQNIKGLIKTAECLIYVRTPVGVVTLNPTSLNINRGKTDIVQVIFNPSTPFNDKVLWTSSNTDVATVKGDSKTATVTAVKGGTSTISVVTMDGLKVASCDVYVREPVTGVSLNQTTVYSEMSIGSYQLSATVLPSGDGVNRKVTWTSSDPTIVTVDANGLVKYVKPGYATIICKTEDGSFIATCNFFVSIPVKTVSLDYTDAIMSLGGKLRITAEVLPITASNRAVAWTSSNTNILVVDSNGLVQAVGTGNATILCKTLDGGVTAMCNVYVKQPVTSVVLNASETTVRKGQVFWLNATALPESADNKIVTWSSTDTKLATVDKDGKVTAVNPGIVTIIATNTDTGLTGFCVVTITQPVTGLTLNSTYQEMWVGSKYAIIPNVLPIDAQNKKVTYQSSDATIASVDENGIVTAIKGGSCIVIVTTDEVKLTATVSIDVKEYVSTISLNETNKFMNIGTALNLTATVTRDSATNKNVVWTSSDSNVVSVDANGHLYANSPGNAVVTATASDGSGVSASCVIRAVIPVTSISVEPDTIKLLVGDSQKAYATVYPEGATIKNVTWVSSNEAIATVDGDGEVFAVGVGKAKITAVSNDGNSIKASCSVYVTPIIKITSLKINSKEITMLSGKTRQLTARITPTNTTESVSWYSTDTSIVVVDDSGRITTVGPGTADIVISGGLNNVESTCIVHSMAISQSSISLEQYDTFDLAVDGAVTAISWRTANPRVATITSSGHIVARMAGTTTITATVDGKTLTCVVRVTNIK
ncbi:Ig-like domain-containing protein [[Clostridium] fimetarium]|nr:Ig-like domain-containing protein [[Clostridium] fimetarium]